MICSEYPKLIDLPADVLLRIFVVCDVVDVMRVETTCKVLRDIVATRHLWLTHLRGLHNRFAPDLAPHVPIESLDGAHLKELVVRAVRGNGNWNSPSPKVTRKIKVGVSNPAGEPFMIVDQAALVPGGDYLTIQSSNAYVQLVSVSNGRRLWLYPDPESSPGPPPSRLWHAVDRISEDVLRIAMAETDQSGVEVLTIKIFEISLCQNWSEKIYDYRLVYDKCLVAFSFQGDHIVIEGDTVGLSFVNWKSRCCINLKSQVYGSSLARQLVNGRLFAVHKDEYFHRPDGNLNMKVTDVNQALEAASAQEENTHALATKSISMDTSPAVTEVELHLSPFHSEFSLQVLNAFLRQENTVDIYLLISCYQYSWVRIMHYTFAPQTRLLASRCAGRLRMDYDSHRIYKMYLSRSGRIAIPRLKRGLVDGSDVHWIFRKHPKDGLRHGVLPYALDTEYHGMDPYSGAILASEVNPAANQTREIRILYFD